MDKGIADSLFFPHDKIKPWRSPALWSMMVMRPLQQLRMTLSS